MIQAKAHVSFEKDGKKCDIYLDNDTPIDVAKEFNYQFGKIIGQIEDNIKAAKEAYDAQKAAEELKEAPKTDLPVTDEVKE